MIPILYNATEVAFTSNGLGRLADAISCLVTEERNGIYELEMEYPVGGRHFGQLLMGNIIMCRASQDTTMQAFRIYDVSDAIDGVTVIKAQHISYQLTSIPVSPFSASTPAQAMAYLSSNSVYTNPFTFSTDIASGEFAISAPDSVRAVIGGIDGNMLSEFGAEVKWDMYTVYILQSRGQDRGKVVRYGKNITDISQGQNIENTITGIYPYYATDDDYVDLTEKILLSSTASAYPYYRIQSLDLTEYFADTPTEEELRTKAQEWLAQVSLGIPRVSIEVSYVDDTDHAIPVYLCDTVTVIFEPLGISTSAKVTQVVWNTLLDRYESITAGVTFDSVADAILDSEDNAVAVAQKAITKQVATAKREITSETDAKIVEASYTYIRPTTINRNAITSGTTGTFLTFHFELNEDDSYVELHLNTYMVAYNFSGTTATITYVIFFDDSYSSRNDRILQAYSGIEHLRSSEWLFEGISSGAHTIRLMIYANGATILPALQDTDVDSWVFAKNVGTTRDELLSLLEQAQSAGDATILTDTYKMNLDPETQTIIDYSDGRILNVSDLHGTCVSVEEDATFCLYSYTGETVPQVRGYYSGGAGYMCVVMQGKIYLDGVKQSEIIARVLPTQGTTSGGNTYYTGHFKTTIPFFSSESDASTYVSAVSAYWSSPTSSNLAAVKAALYSAVFEY